MKLSLIIFPMHNLHYSPMDLPILNPSYEGTQAIKHQPWTTTDTMWTKLALGQFLFFFLNFLFLN